MTVEVAVRAGLPFVGVVVAAVVGAAVLRPIAVDRALGVIDVVGVALDHRLPAVGLLAPADDLDVGPGLEVDRPDVLEPVPAVLVLHELATAAWCLAIRAIGIRLFDRHDDSSGGPGGTV